MLTQIGLSKKAVTATDHEWHVVMSRQELLSEEKNDGIYITVAGHSSENVAWLIQTTLTSQYQNLFLCLLVFIVLFFSHFVN